jgi:hypothetical protein
VWSIIACKHRKFHIIQIHRRPITHLWDCTVNNNTMKAGSKHANSGENQNKHEKNDCDRKLVSIRPSTSPWMALTICNYSPLTLLALENGFRSVYNHLLKISGKQFYRNLHAEFLSHFWMEWEDWVMMLDSRANLKSQPVSSSKLQQACEASFFSF